MIPRSLLIVALMLFAGCTAKPPPQVAPAVPAGPSYADLCKLVDVKEREWKDAQDSHAKVKEMLESNLRWLNQRLATTTNVSEYEALQTSIAKANSEAGATLAKSEQLVALALQDLSKAKARRDKAAP